MFFLPNNNFSDKKCNYVNFIMMLALLSLLVGIIAISLVFVVNKSEVNNMTLFALLWIKNCISLLISRFLVLSF